MGADTTVGSALNNSINFNGASFVTIEGKNSPDDLFLSSTATTTNPNTCAVLFVNDARDNVLRPLYLASAAQSTLTNVNATVLFSGTSGIQGNDRNLIEDCVFIPSIGSGPTNHLASINGTLD